MQNNGTPKRNCTCFYLHFPSVTMFAESNKVSVSLFHSSPVFIEVVYSFFFLENPFLRFKHHFAQHAHLPLKQSEFYASCHTTLRLLLCFRSTHQSTKSQTTEQWWRWWPSSSSSSLMGPLLVLHWFFCFSILFAPSTTVPPEINTRTFPKHSGNCCTTIPTRKSPKLTENCTKF